MSLSSQPPLISHMEQGALRWRGHRRGGDGCCYGYGSGCGCSSGCGCGCGCCRERRSCLGARLLSLRAGHHRLDRRVPALVTGRSATVVLARPARRAAHGRQSQRRPATQSGDARDPAGKQNLSFERCGRALRRNGGWAVTAVTAAPAPATRRHSRQACERIRTEPAWHDSTRALPDLRL